MASPQPALSELDVSNVYLYIGDAVRWDERPSPVTSQGCTVKTISASTHSPTSFAALATGWYPPKTGVFSFEHTIPEEMARIFDLPLETQFINSIFAYAARMHGGDYDPIYDVLRCDASLDGAEFAVPDDPFFVMERGPGGHAPYGEFDGTGAEYYRTADADNAVLRSDYQRSIELDASFFQQRVELLSDAGVLDDTLVIYTSDHGELLGEGGGIGHNSPMRPELVYVPTVYIHPELSTGTITSGAHHHVDITATCCDVLGYGDRVDALDGTSLARGLVKDPRPCYYRKTFGTLPGGIDASLEYDGVWNADGGHVFPTSSRISRLAVIGGLLTQSPKRKHIFNNLHWTLVSHLASDCVYGTPGFDKTEAASVLDQVARSERKSVGQNLSSDAEERLSDLGYI